MHGHYDRQLSAYVKPWMSHDAAGLAYRFDDGTVRIVYMTSRFGTTEIHLHITSTVMYSSPDHPTGEAWLSQPEPSRDPVIRTFDPFADDDE